MNNSKKGMALGGISPTFWRWIDLITLTIISILICLILFPLFQAISNKFTHILIKWPFWIQYFIISLLSGFLWFLIIRLGGFRFFDVKPSNFFRYPPVWIFGIFGSCLYLWLTYAFIENNQNFFSSENNKILVICGSSIALGFISSVFLNKSFLFDYRKNYMSEQNHSGLTVTFNDITNNEEQLLQWIKEEAPIKHPSKAIFGLPFIAKRIAGLLINTELKTIGVVGPYGSGKSSLLNLVAYYLNNTPEIFNDSPLDSVSTNTFKGEILFCHVDGWGRTSGSIAQQILTIAMNRLKSEVDCLSIITLPANYRNALAGTKNTYATILAALLNPDEDPINTLKRLDRILQASNKRLIIFLEDLDRNFSDASIHNEMSALLDRLRCLNNVSFILAIGTEHHYSNTLIRICDHVESLTLISLNDLIKIIKPFQDYCLKIYTDDIDILPPEVRNNRLELPIQNEFWSSELKGVIHYISGLINSPRLLKMILRRTLYAWEILHGEIDYYDLLIVNILRFAAPEAYDFLLSNITEIRGLESDGIAKKRDEKKVELQKKWDMAKTNAEWNTVAAEELIATLFPYWDVKRFTGFQDIPQGIRYKYPTDYWIRATSECFPSSDIRDQEILHSIQKWKSDHSATSFRGLQLPEALYKIVDISDKFEYLGKFLLNGEDIRKLAQSFFKIILDDKKSAANPKEIPAFLSLWRLSLENSIEENPHYAWIADEISKALPINLHFANELYYYWKHHESGASSEDKRPWPAVRIPTVKLAEKLFKDSPQSLITAIEFNPSYSIYQFAVLFSLSKHGGSGFNPEEWKWLADSLLNGAELNPEIVLPQILKLIFRRDMQKINEYVYIFEEEFSQQLFNKRMPEAMKLLAQEFEYAHKEKHEQEEISFARQTAHEWLNKNI